MPVKHPHSANITWWDKDSVRQDMNSTIGNCALALFKALPVAAQRTLLDNINKEHQYAVARSVKVKK